VCLKDLSFQCRRAYGGLVPYMDSIGFDEDERDRLRAALSDGVSTPDVKPGAEQNGVEQNGAHQSGSS